MLLLFDVGNTHTVAGITRDGKNFLKWRLSTHRFETEDELFVILRTLLDNAAIKSSEIDSVVIASVVPSVNYIFHRFCDKYLGVGSFWVEACDGLDIKWNVKSPSEIGADRVANVIGAADICEDAIILDSGTAITVDVLMSNSYEGGAILPGLMTAAYSLFEKTAKLPQVDLHTPGNCVGKDTAENIRIGIVKGTAHALNGIVEEVKRCFSNEPKIFLTGGQSKILEKLVRHDVKDPDLTLKGMYRYWRKKCTSCS
ncbi:MAG: type III pantothenate kinase [Pseudothermotoga sp.]